MEKQWLTTVIDYYTIDSCVRDSALFKEKEKHKMQNVSLHRQFIGSAKQAGFMPTYWSCLEISLSNDRTGKLGSVEDRVA
jgi:hypothetical protein